MSWSWSYVVNSTTCAISAYHHLSCEFESRPWQEVYSIQYYVIKFVSDLRQVGCFLRVLWFPPSIKLMATIYWNIVESAVKHYNSDVVRSRQPAIFAGNCPFLAGYFSMSKKKCNRKIHIPIYILIITSYKSTLLI
jgi:hypothetical protein